MSGEHQNLRFLRIQLLKERPVSWEIAKTLLEIIAVQREALEECEDCGDAEGKFAMYVSGEAITKADELAEGLPNDN